MHKLRTQNTQQPTMEAIDKSKLETDLMYRYNYVCKFVGFGADDIKTIKDCKDLIQPLVPKIVDEVYVKLFSFDITKAPFLKRNIGYQGKLAKNLDDLDLTNEQIRFRKDILSKYLAKLVTSEYDKQFVTYLNWVGKIHTNTGKKALAIDYVHINALMGYLVDLIITEIYASNFSTEKKEKAVRAFNKLLWVQMDLFARHYIGFYDETTGELKPANGKPQEKQHSFTIPWWVAGVVGGFCGAALCLLYKKQ